MKEKEEERKKHEEKDRRAEKDIPSKQDKSWVGENQMPQQQFDKTEFEDEEGDGLDRKCRK